MATFAEMEEEQRRRGAGQLPPPPPLTAGTPYGVPQTAHAPLPAPNVVTFGSGAGAPQPLPPPAVAPPPPVAPPAVPVQRARPSAVTPAGLAAGAAPTTPTMGVTAANEFETPAQRQARELQLKAANEALAVIGGAVTPAQLQMQQGLDRAAAQQQSQAAGARGMAVAGARRQAARQIADIQQGGVGQSALLRAEEQSKARGDLATIAGQVRGQDIDVTSQGAAMIDRAKRNAQDFAVSMQDLELREKLGLLTDEREKAHLEEQRRSNQAIEALKSRGLDMQAQQAYEEMLQRNKEFWGGFISNLAGAGVSLARSGG